jgi:hypothetical protein
MQMAGVEEAEDMTAVEVMKKIKSTENDVRKERKASLQHRLHE